MLPLPSSRPTASDASTPRRRLSRLATLLASTMLVASLAFGVGASTVEPPPEPGTGKWINVVVSDQCQPTATRVCAEFIDDIENSPLTGMFCCLERSEIPLGNFSSCERLFRNPPREGDDELGGRRPQIED